MNIFAQFRKKIDAQIVALTSAGTLPEGLDTSRITLEPPRDSSHGDIATNAAMVLSKPAGMKPRDLAELIVAGLQSDDDVTHAEIAGPGFINISVAPVLLHAVVERVLTRPDDYGQSPVGAGQKVNVEYVSANPTGPLHVGHCRGAVFGDALCALLEKGGYDVTREYYINDAGSQIDILAQSTYLRYLEALGEDIGKIPEGLYPGDYLVPVGQKIAQEDGDKWRGLDEADWLEHFRVTASGAMMDLIREDLAVLGISMDVFVSERSLHADGKIDRALQALEEKGLIYEGVLDPPKGKLPDDWEARPQTLFRATKFGDDVDRALKKSDGSWTYFAADIAYHQNKLERGFYQQVDVWGADHGGYVKRMKSAVSAISLAVGDQEAELDVKLCQMVKLLKNGEPFIMSKRSGTFVTLRDVVDEVGKDVVRFIMLTRKNDAPLDFDFAKVVEQSRDNPVFYVQYAHARVCSVLRRAGDEVASVDTTDASLAGAELSGLTDGAEINLMKKMADWPRTIDAAAQAHEPHRIAFYLNELAAMFHAYWNKGNDDKSLRFIQPTDLSITRARLALIRSVALVIASGLQILGVTPVEEMH
ncbi:MAG: arginine--tRNA ligase [Alphaproteobacteria bacterium]|nr:MAG: arginine--tRNA ligase [Alphaproteobacteria bacterium]